MKRLLPYPEARRILGRVSEENAFWLCTNENLQSLTSLVRSLEKVDDDVFRYHVTRDKNDFEMWIRDIVEDKDLAREIARVKTKETLIRKINERLALLKKIVKRHRNNTLRRKAKKAGKVKKAGKAKRKPRPVRLREKPAKSRKKPVRKRSGRQR